MRKTTITIELKFGSEFQKDTMMNSMMGFLEVFNRLFKEKHAKNEIIFSIEHHN